jgi:hypothetical protein
MEKCTTNIWTLRKQYDMECDRLEIYFYDHSLHLEQR